MRRAALLAPWALLVITVDVARGQFGPDAMRESVPFRVRSDLIDDTHLAGGEEIASAPGRFVVIVLRGEAVLVDTASGATWRLVFGAANEVPLRWAPIPRERAEPRRRIRRRIREQEQSGATPSGRAVLVSAAAEPMPTNGSPEEETTPSDEAVERASATCVAEILQIRTVKRRLTLDDCRWEVVE